MPEFKKITRIFPKIEPYRKGFLQVSRTHKLYYELCGNPHGTPVLFVHGGPGGGISERSRRYFDPKIFNILLFDQRGAGKSIPFASIEENTTQLLVGDIKKLLEHVGITKTLIFGGSWGSTLSLCYAIKYPKTVLGMVLRGIFLGTREEIEYLYLGNVENHHPEKWERFITQLPKNERKDPIGNYLKRMRSKNEKIRTKFAFEWEFFESALVSVHPNYDVIEEKLRSGDPLAISRIEAHYMQNNCFLSPNYILRNVRRIKGIPIAIIHGRWDCVCPLKFAYKLHKALPSSRLNIIPDAGHGMSERGIAFAMMEEIHRLQKEL